MLRTKGDASRRFQTPDYGRKYQVEEEWREADNRLKNLSVDNGGMDCPGLYNQPPMVDRNKQNLVHNDCLMRTLAHNMHGNPAVMLLLLKLY